jgi:hypothetical protein
MTTTLEKNDRWTVDELAKELPGLFAPGEDAQPRQ